MKQLYFFIMFNIVAFQGTGQKKYDLSFSTGWSQYAQTDLKKWEQNNELYWQNFGVRTVTNFPLYLQYYTVEFSRKIGNRFSLGLTYRYQSTRYKSTYTSNLGDVRFEQLLKANQIGLLVKYTLWQYKKLTLSAQTRTYYCWSNSKLTFVSQSSGVLSPIALANSNDSEIFVSHSIIIIPGFDLSYRLLEQLAISVGLGYCFDLKGDLKYKQQGYHYTMIYQKIQSDWSGMSAGLTLHYLL